MMFISSTKLRFMIVLVMMLGSSSVSSNQSIPSRDELKSVATSIAKHYDLSADLIHALITVESDWQPAVVSKKGAVGLMQLMPATAERFAVVDSYDPYQNLQGGMRYLRFLFNRFHGRLDLVLAAYNAGENAVDRYNGIPPYSETQAYVHKVLKLYGAPASPVRSVRRIRSYPLMRAM
ncbi:MAG: lytic transglycosylase domain-containing protein [Candidatus Thiodiazotropha sp. (ex Ctena orbiculata)]|nr:lytic transglycosylase domain-containing protein [Candidatus Thiodiazotropha taylori]